jgi:signal peptidase I
VRLLNRIWRTLTERALGVVITVTNISMEPTFPEGTRAMLKPRGYRNAKPRRFDVVVVRPPGPPRPPGVTGEDIKRIVGLPGELIEIRDGELWIDGEVVQEPHIADHMPMQWLHTWGTRDHEYIVLGDNRAAPGIIDSRRYGPLKANAVIGQVTRRLD